jgi:hypothetical protein
MVRLPAPLLALLTTALGAAAWKAEEAPAPAVVAAVVPRTPPLATAGSGVARALGKRQIYTFGLNDTASKPPSGTGIVPVALSEDKQCVSIWAVLREELLV